MICKDCGKSGSNGCPISCIHKKLCALYPMVDAYESRAAVWQHGLKDEIVNRHEYDRARLYFGTIWNYTGD